MGDPKQVPEENGDPRSGRAHPGRPQGRPRREALTLQQQHAIIVLASTDNCALAARVVGVDERTVRRWRREHPAFRRELDRRRAETLLAVEEEEAAVMKDVLARRRELISCEDEAVAWRVVSWHLERYERVKERFATATDVAMPVELQTQLDALDEADGEGGVG